MANPYTHSDASRARTRAAPLRRRAGTLVASAATILSWAMSSPGAAAAQDAATPPYTKEQAAEGAEIYARHCASCHGAELDGTLAPPLLGEAFRINWYVGDRTARNLLDTIAENMPMTAPGSLSPEQYAAITAFLLSKNGHAPTGTPLTADADALDAILVAPRDALQEKDDR